MEDLSKALIEALEDKISLSDQDNNLQSSSLNGSKLARRPLRKRRGRKRRLDPNPIWEFSVVLSDQSDTSLDEALKDYMQNVTETKDRQSDSANEDRMLKKLSSLNVTSSSNLYGESDSVAESSQHPQKPLRKKKSRPKRMAVDGGTQSCVMVTRSCSLPDFKPQIKSKKQRLKKSPKKNDKQNENMEVLNYEAIEDRFGNKKKVPQRSKAPSKGQKLTAQNMEIDCETVNCRTSSPEVAGVCRSRVTEGPLAESRTQSSSSDGTISRTDDRAESAMSGDDDDTSETLLGRDASCSSESSEDDGLFTNDEGREADDEQSDFFHEPGGSIAGVPHIIPWWEKSPKDKEDEEKFYKILNGALPLLNKGTQKNFNSRLKNCQNRVDDCGNFRSLRSRFKPRRLRKTSAPGQLNDRVVRFLKKPNTNEIDLQTLRKTKHQLHLDHLASIYSLDLQTNTKAFLKNPALCGAAANNDFYMASSSTESSLLPLEDTKRRRKSPRKLTNEGKVGGSAAPIPESNVGNQMLQNMGWKPGTGLGAKGRGVKEPVQVFVRPKNRGLGHWKPS